MLSIGIEILHKGTVYTHGLPSTAAGSSVFPKMMIGIFFLQDKHTESSHRLHPCISGRGNLRLLCLDSCFRIQWLYEFGGACGCVVQREFMKVIPFTLRSFSHMDSIEEIAMRNLNMDMGRISFARVLPVLSNECF